MRQKYSSHTVILIYISISISLSLSLSLFYMRQHLIRLWHAYINICKRKLQFKWRQKQHTKNHKTTKINTTNKQHQSPHPPEWWRQRWSRYECRARLAERLHRQRRCCLHTRRWHTKDSSRPCTKLCKYLHNYR